MDGTPSSVLGTPMFMAPEIVEGMAAPSTRTDLWSLAVLLFHAFMLHHPLVGRREVDIPVLDEEGQKALFGVRARFIFDPTDSSNEPVPGLHDNALASWPIYPLFLRRLFTRAFTEGIRDDRRVLETEWRNAMVQLRDSIMHCPQCRAVNFYDAEVTATRACWSCKAAPLQAKSITIGKMRVVLTDGTELFPHHLDPERRLNFSKPLAVFSRNPDRPSLVGLKNLGEQPWRAVLPDGAELRVEQGRTVVLLSGCRISFGQLEGLVN